MIEFIALLLAANQPDGALENWKHEAAPIFRTSGQFQAVQSCKLRDDRWNLIAERYVKAHLDGLPHLQGADAAAASTFGDRETARGKDAMGSCSDLAKSPVLGDLDKLEKRWAGK